jgi:hypothetical protein
MKMRAGNALLALGAALGLALAAIGLVARPPPPEALPAGAVALVNGRPIWRADLERAVSAAAAALKAQPDPDLRRRIAARLVEEELLVQRGLEIGIAERDPRVRADLGAATIDHIVARAADEAQDPGPGELRRFFAENAEYFRRPARLSIEAFFFRAAGAEGDAAALARARAARARLARGEPVSSDPPPVPLPSGPLGPREIERGLGPTAARALTGLEAGAVAGPVRGGEGYYLVAVRERIPGIAPDFEAVRAQVLAEWRRRSGERALRRFLDARRAAARIVLAPDAR